MSRFTARFWNGESRTLRAKHLAHAQKIAQGLAKSNGWKFKSVGRV